MSIVHFFALILAWVFWVIVGLLALWWFIMLVATKGWRS